MGQSKWLRVFVALCAAAVLGVSMAQTKGPDPAYLEAAGGDHRPDEGQSGEVGGVEDQVRRCEQP